MAHSPSVPRATAKQSPDFADFCKFYDHYLPRVFAFALRRTADAGGAERLTEAVLQDALSHLRELRPGAAADEAILAAARRLAAARSGS